MGIFFSSKRAALVPSARPAPAVDEPKGTGSSRSWTFAKDVLLVTVVLVIATVLALAVAFVGRNPTAQATFDFSLDVRPLSNPVAPGNSTTTTVTATATSGLTHDIEFSCTDLPSGASCAFTPSFCRPTCSTNLVLSTSASSPPGSHLVTVAASDGTINRTTTFRLDLSVSPPPASNFSIGLNPRSGSVQPGGSASTNVTATLDAGSAHAVQFSCGNLPPGTTCTFLPPSCVPSCQAALTVATSASTPGGAYPINVNATDGSLSRSAMYSLTVSNVSNATTLTFQKGHGAFGRTDDATIYSGAPTRNFGYDPLLLVDEVNCIANGSICRALMMFPEFLGPQVGQVPRNATIVSALLEVNVTNSGADQHLAQVAEAWNESAVTWNAFATPGMPRLKGPAIMFNSTLGLNTLNVTSIVQNWVRGDANDGVFIWSTSWNGSDYQSSESNHPPKLTVTFRPAGAALVRTTGSGSASRGPPGFPVSSLSAPPGPVWAFVVQIPQGFDSGMSEARPHPPFWSDKP